jgi:hypothetical protein
MACIQPSCVAAAGTGAIQDACAADGCGSDADANLSCSARPLEQKRLDLLLVLDDSASLAPWWPALREGLEQFLEEGASRGLGVGLVSPGEVCDPQQYVVPLVPIAPLPGNLSALQQAIPSDAQLSTSTIPALSGALMHARSWATAHADAHVAVLLVSDASPGACDGLIGDYDGEAGRVARAAREGSPSIDTYVINVSTLQTAATIAKEGGTEAVQIGILPADGEVQAAFDKLRQAARPCAFAWPDGVAMASASQVVVAGAAGSERRYDVHQGAQACASGGFYVEDATAPYPLIACPDTCAALTADDQVSVPCSAP